jgi:hypothetical protein
VVNGLENELDHERNFNGQMKTEIQKLEVDISRKAKECS